VVAVGAETEFPEWNLYETPARRFPLTIYSTPGGEVTEFEPGVGTFTYDEGTVLNLVAPPKTGYRFVCWTGDVNTIANVYAYETTITMNGDCSITARFTAVVDSKTETVSNGTVDAKDEADTEVEVTGNATVTISQFADNPGGYSPTGFNSLDKYIDVYIPYVGDVTEIEIRLHYTDDEVPADIEEDSLQLFWWNGTIWQVCIPSGVNTADNYVWAQIRTAGTIPTLAELAGTPFAAYGSPPSPAPTPQPPAPTPRPPVRYCFIATAAYGTPMSEEIEILREFRDHYLLTNPLGRTFVDFYYRVSPPIAEFITEHPSLKPIVRAGLLPVVATSSVVVNTTRTEKAITVGLVVLVLMSVTIWVIRRRGKGPKYS